MSLVCEHHDNGIYEANEGKRRDKGDEHVVEEVPRAWSRE